MKVAADWCETEVLRGKEKQYGDCSRSEVGHGSLSHTESG